MKNEKWKIYNISSKNDNFPLVLFRQNYKKHKNSLKNDKISFGFGLERLEKKQKIIILKIFIF